MSGLKSPCLLAVELFQGSAEFTSLVKGGANCVHICTKLSGGSDNWDVDYGCFADF